MGFFLDFFRVPFWLEKVERSQKSSGWISMGTSVARNISCEFHFKVGGVFFYLLDHGMII